MIGCIDSANFKSFRKVYLKKGVFDVPGLLMAEPLCKDGDRLILFLTLVIFRSPFKRNEN